MTLLFCLALLAQTEIQKIIIIAVTIVLGVLALFFLYSIAVIVLYWLILLLPLLALAAGIFLRLQDVMAGNIIIGMALAWAVVWYALVFSKKRNWLRRILDSLNRSLP